MKLPFPMFTLNSDIAVFENLPNDDGDVELNEILKCKARYDRKNRQVLNADRQLILLTGKIVIPGIYQLPHDVESKSLYIKVNEIEKRVHSIEVIHNPDQSVFSYELNLI